MAIGHGGGFGGVSIQPADMGALIQAARPPEFVQFLQGLAQLPGDIEQGETMAQEAAYRREQMEQMRAQRQQTQMQNAQAVWDQLGKEGIANPNVGNNPVFKAKLQRAANALGYDMPVNQDGSVDFSSWKTNINDMFKDRDFSERWFAADPAQRKAMATGLSGVTPEMINSAPVLTSKEQNDIDKYHLDSTKTTAMISNNRLITQYRTGLMGAQTYEARARGAEAYQTGQARLETAKAAMKRANDAISIANIRAQAALSKASAKSRSGDIIARTAVTSAQRAYDEANRQLAGARAAFIDAKTAGADSVDSATMQTLETNMTKYEGMVQQTEQQLKDAQALYAQDMGQGGTAKEVKQQSGAHQVKAKYATPPGNSVYGTDTKGNRFYYVPGDPNVYDINNNVIPGMTHP